MAIKILGTDVIDNSRGLVNITSISAGSTTGTAGQVLKSTGNNIEWGSSISVNDSNIIGFNNLGIRSDGGNGRLEVFGQGNFQVFTSPGTFIVNPGISSIRVRVVGAGGKGGDGSTGIGSTSGAPPDSFFSGISGGGGGGGGYAHKVITSFTTPRTYIVTAGTSPGGTSSFGSEVSATGGSAGTNGTPVPWSPPSPPPSPVSGGTGGTGSGGDVNFTGATGLPSPGPAAGGKGGSSATQKGNGSGSSVPGLPSNTTGPIYSPNGPATSIITPPFLDPNFINRFPFDIFNGYNGISVPGSVAGYPAPKAKSGFNGGSGSDTDTSSSNPAADGGHGAGGGGGSRFFPGNSTIGRPGGAGGFGGGGGGGSGGASNLTSPPSGPFISPGGTGGAGGNGIIIVEW